MVFVPYVGRKLGDESVRPVGVVERGDGVEEGVSIGCLAGGVSFLNDLVGDTGGVEEGVVGAEEVKVGTDSLLDSNGASVNGCRGEVVGNSGSWEGGVSTECEVSGSCVFGS